MASVTVAESALGSILADDKGMTLYVFLPDNAGDPTCYEGCATAWPPLLSDAAPTVGAGLDAAAFGTADRTDGGTQVTFNGWPLYPSRRTRPPATPTARASTTCGSWWALTGP